MAEDRTELDVAKAIRDGALPSPQRFMNLWLFAMRITGTGAAYRDKDNEYSWRDPKEWTAPEFLDRCNGLPVIFDHPTAGLLDSEGDEYANRVVGAIMLPYAKGEEAWGIARIQDDATAELLQNVQLSTSPGVSANWGTDADRTNLLRIKLDDGSKLLVEGKPSFVCHLAICKRGVWDKNGAPTGIDGGLMTDEEKREKEKADAAAAAKAKADAEEKQEKDPAEKERADAATKTAQARADADDDMRKKMDAMQAKLDAYEAADKEKREEKEKSDAALAKAKADADEKDKEAKEREEKAKADVAAVKADAAKTQARLDAIEAMYKPRTDADEAALATEQSKADAVEQAWGRSAPRYQPNETRRAYIVRTLHEHKEHSPHWKGVDLSTLPIEALNIAAEQIRADSVAASRNPMAGPTDQLIKRTRSTGTGHMITEYFGDVHAEMAPFRIPPRFANLIPRDSRG